MGEEDFVERVLFAVRLSWTHRDYGIDHALSAQVETFPNSFLPSGFAYQVKDSLEKPPCHHTPCCHRTLAVISTRMAEKEFIERASFAVRLRGLIVPQSQR
jgi:hypothetical protein